MSILIMISDEFANAVAKWQLIRAAAFINSHSDHQKQQQLFLFHLPRHTDHRRARSSYGSFIATQRSRTRLFSPCVAFTTTASLAVIFEYFLIKRSDFNFHKFVRLFPRSYACMFFNICSLKEVSRVINTHVWVKSDVYTNCNVFCKQTTCTDSWILTKFKYIP